MGRMEVSILDYHTVDRHCFTVGVKSRSSEEETWYVVVLSQNGETSYRINDIALYVREKLTMNLF